MGAHRVSTTAWSALLRPPRGGLPSPGGGSAGLLGLCAACRASSQEDPALPSQQSRQGKVHGTATTIVDPATRYGAQGPTAWTLRAGRGRTPLATDPSCGPAQTPDVRPLVPAPHSPVSAALQVTLSAAQAGPPGTSTKSIPHLPPSGLPLFIPASLSLMSPTPPFRGPANT